VGLRHNSFVNSVGWSPDGLRLASAGEDQTVRIWNAETGQELETLRGHRASIEAVNWSSDGKRLASGEFEYGDEGAYEEREDL
jgi:WD40 repeat protein